MLLTLDGDFLKKNADYVLIDGKRYQYDIAYDMPSTIGVEIEEIQSCNLDSVAQKRVKNSKPIGVRERERAVEKIYCSFQYKLGDSGKQQVRMECFFILSFTSCNTEAVLEKEAISII